MKQREINPDEAINRVLTGLREAEPLEGMQQRVLHAAKERAGVRHRWTLQFSLAGTRSWILAAGSVAVVALVASWTIARGHRIAHGNTNSSAHLSPAKTSPIETPLASAPIATAQSPHTTRRSSAEKSAEPIESDSSEDALALSEMRAPSQPAPPMPLTEQERLLLGMLRKGDPVELAMLDPRFRSLEEANSKAEFDRFFAPKPIIGGKSPTTINQPLTGESPATANQPATGDKSDLKKQ